MGLFNLPMITRIQRNHGLEHATIHILSRRNGNLSLVGRSDWHGFTLYGPVDTSEVKHAAHEALRRLRDVAWILAGLAIGGIYSANDIPRAEPSAAAEMRSTER